MTDRVSEFARTRGDITVHRLLVPGANGAQRDISRGALHLVRREATASDEGRELFAASVSYALQAVSPSRVQRIRNWLEMLGHWSDLCGDTTLQLRMIGGEGKAPQIELLVHSVAESPELAASGLREASTGLATLWQMLGGAYVWRPVRTNEQPWALPFHDAGNIAELHARESKSADGAWCFRAFRCLVSDSGHRELPWQWPNGARFVFATTLRSVVPTSAERKAMQDAGEVIGEDDERVFEARLHVASDQPLEVATVNFFGQRLLGHSGGSGVLDDSAADPMRWKRGGFVVAQPTNGDEVALARANLLFGAMQPWERTSAPPELLRARRLVPVVPAMTVFPAPSDRGQGVAVPTPERLPDRGGIVVGEVGAGGDSQSVHQADADAALHTYVVGKTGTGKSTLLLNMILGRIAEGHGVAVIDPHGDLAFDVIGRIAPERMRDVVLFDATDVAYPQGLNLLDHDPAHPESQTFLVNELLAMLNDMYDMRTMAGPIFEMIFRNGLLALMDVPGSTIADLARFLTDTPYRTSILRKCKNPRVRSVFEEDLNKITGENSLANMAHYVTSKLDAFVGDRFVAPIVSQADTTIAFGEILARRKILIVRLNKGQIGSIASHLLGMVVLARLLSTALARSNQSIGQLLPFHVFVDEFHNVMTHGMVAMLSEARKYGLRLTMAHQHIDQLRSDLRTAVLGNVGTTIAFRVGPEDARLLAHAACDPELAAMLPGLANYHAAIRATCGGEQLPPFVMRTLAAVESPGAAAKIAQAQGFARAMAARGPRVT